MGETAFRRPPLVFPRPARCREPSPVCSVRPRLPRQRAELLVRLEIRGSSSRRFGNPAGVAGRVRSFARARATAGAEGLGEGGRGLRWCASASALQSPRGCAAGEKVWPSLQKWAPKGAEEGESRKRLSLIHHERELIDRASLKSPSRGASRFHVLLIGSRFRKCCWEIFAHQKERRWERKTKASATAPG